ATCTGVCATSYTLYLVGHDWNGGVTAEVASNTITNGPATLSGTNYVTLCWTAVDGLEKWDILSDTSHSIAIGQGVPVSGTTQCYKYTGGALSAYAGDWNTTDNLHRKPRDINVLPTVNVTAGDTYVVDNWNGTVGVCTGGGTTYTTAIWSGSAWHCP